jgi:hypothetical protein
MGKKTVMFFARIIPPMRRTIDEFLPMNDTDGDFLRSVFPNLNAGTPCAGGVERKGYPGNFEAFLTANGMGFVG